jgi:hypothetical protein
MLRVDPVGSLAALGLEGFDSVASFFHRAGHEAADRVFLPSHLVHDLDQRGPVLPLQQRDDLGGLAALTRTSAFIFLSSFLGFGRGLGGDGLFLVALAVADAPLAAFALPLAFLSAFGFAGSGAGSAALPSPWMASQILLAPALVVLNPFTGFTPGRLFQIATKRSAGHAAANCANSFSLVKNS